MPPAVYSWYWRKSFAKWNKTAAAEDYRFLLMMVRKRRNWHSEKCFSATKLIVLQDTDSYTGNFHFNRSSFKDFLSNHLLHFLLILSILLLLLLTGKKVFTFCSSITATWQKSLSKVCVKVRSDSSKPHTSSLSDPASHLPFHSP